MLIRKQQTLHIPKKYLFNAGAAVFCIATAVVVVRETVIPKPVPTCDQRYAKAGVFAWNRGDGTLLSALDLQAKLNGRDWGTLENVSFRKTEELQLGSAMDIQLRREAAKRDPRRPSGAGFVWTPSWLNGAEQACLAYSVKLPKDFEFGAGGSLPGLFGGNKTAVERYSDRNSDGFSMRFHWRENGLLDLRVKSAEYPMGTSYTIDKDYLKIEPGAWLSIENEVVLNTPGLADGLLRVWVNGKLALDVKNVGYRLKAEDRIGGIIANVHYANRDLNWVPAPKDSKVSLSPFFVKWQ